MYNKKLKLMSLGLSLMLTVGIIAGCGNSKKDPEPKEQSTVTEQSAEATEKEKVTIRVMTRWSGVDTMAPLQQAVIKEFMDKNPHINVVDESINEESAYLNKIKADIATGTMPNLIHINNVEEYAKNGLIMDMTPVIAEDKAWSDGFIGGLFDNWKYPGLDGIYGVPLGVDYEVFYYNTELFAKAGITETPKTYTQFLDVIQKLKTAGIVPIGAGVKDAWRAGHIHNALLYKTCGVQKAKDIALRTAKWTDPEVVQSLKYLKDLWDMGAFDKNAAGIDYNSEKANFYAGKSAMVYNGDWFIGEVRASEAKDKVKTFLFPNFEDKSQFNGENILFIDGLALNGKAEGAEKQAQVDFIKFFTSIENQKKMAEDVKRPPARKDIQFDESKFDPLFAEIVKYAPEIQNPGKDSFGYDSLLSMQDRTRNSIIGMLLGNTPEQAAKEMQDEIDKNTK